MANILQKIINFFIILRVFYWHTILATIRYYLGKTESYALRVMQGADIVGQIEL